MQHYICPCYAVVCWCWPPNSSLASVNFLHSSLYGAMFLICVEKSVDKTILLWVLLSSAYTESRPFLFLLQPCQRGGWGFTRRWEGKQLGHLTPTDPTFHLMSCYKIKGILEEKSNIDVLASDIKQNINISLKTMITVLH